RNHAIPLGQPASLDTADPAPSAVELLLASLGGCLAVGLQWRLSREGVAVRNLEITLRARSRNLLVFLGAEDEGSPALEGVEGTAWVDADADEDRLRRAFDETLRRSPVARSLLGEVPLSIQVKTA
ncbi:MAG: OsmC family protein, partial [Planctomycetaceae bacterium]|nr:OsmC family protein [Planctomycetaceae bacterium]